MAKLIIECSDAGLLKRLARGAGVELAQLQIVTKEPRLRREAAKALASITVKE